MNSAANVSPLERHIAAGGNQSSTAPWQGFCAPFTYWTLFCRLTRREVESRYRGSLLGILWSLLSPLLMLVVYTFVFSQIFRAKWHGNGDDEFALYLFSGLILFNIFAESIVRAPDLLIENASYIKKVIFPLDLIPWVAVGGVLFHSLMSIAVLLLGYLVVLGLPPLTALLVPAILVPFVLFTLGVTFFLAALGVFVRDIRYLLGILTSALMFLSPIFYPASALPERYRLFFLLNPLSIPLEHSKALLFHGILPSGREFLFFCAVALVTFWAGVIWFSKTKRGFADVI